MDRARTGGGPTLLEGTCYRFLAHSTDDNDMTYRTREEVTEQRKHDPVPRSKRACSSTASSATQDVAAMSKDVLRETNEATDRGRGACRIRKPSDLYTHVYEGAWQPWQS